MKTIYKKLKRNYDLDEFHVKYSTGERFTIYSNVEKKGNPTFTNIKQLFDLWCAESNEFSSKSLCAFIQNKNPEFIAITESELNKYLKVNNLELYDTVTNQTIKP